MKKKVTLKVALLYSHLSGLQRMVLKKELKSAEIMSDSSLGKNASAAEDHTRRNNYQLRTETEATVHTGSLKHDDRKLEKCCLFR